MQSSGCFEERWIECAWVSIYCACMVVCVFMDGWMYRHTKTNSLCNVTWWIQIRIRIRLHLAEGGNGGVLARCTTRFFWPFTCTTWSARLARFTANFCEHKNTLRTIPSLWLGVLSFKHKRYADEHNQAKRMRKNNVVVDHAASEIVLLVSV